MSYLPSRFLLLATLLGLTMIDGLNAAPNPEPYPKSTSKKGLMVKMAPDALALGIKHAVVNCSLAVLIDPSASPKSIPFAFEGQTYSFQPGMVAALDAAITPLSSQGVVVTLILLNRESSNETINTIMLHPRYQRGAPNKMSAFNTVTPEGVRWLRAMVTFLAERYSDPAAPHGRVWNYIVGNEVNSHWWWNNMGHASAAEVASDYERAVRIVHDAVRTASVNARVFLSLDHFWKVGYPAGTADQSCGGRPLIEEFARLARQRGDFDWHIAHHPYPENLREPCFWRDPNARSAEDTNLVTFKNLEVLTAFLRRPELLWQGKPRRVILSEQGFNCPDRPEGERDQAAGFCAAWVKISRLEGIDAFILHRHVDHRSEGGLNLGLWTRRADSVETAERKRQMYDLFRVADTPGWEASFAFALPIVGIKSWDVLAKKPVAP